MSAKVTVLTATYKRDDLLKRAIESVLNQTHKKFEYIIIDDDPSKATKELVESFKDDRLHYITNEENPARTHCRPLNTGLKKATGEYIAYLDDDNEWYPYHLEVLLNVMKDSDVDVAYCDMLVEDPDGNQQQAIALDFDAQFLLNRNFIDTSNIMHTKDMAFNVGGWDEKIKRFTDWNLMVRMMKWGAKFKRVPIVATKYYIGLEDTQSSRTEVKSWFDPALGLTMFEPTFDPAGCYIFENYLKDNPSESNPKIAVMTKTYGRLDYTKRMYDSLKASTNLKWDWYVFDQGSDDGTIEWLEKSDAHYVNYNGENVGISKADNSLLDAMDNKYDVVFHVDNDCEFMTRHCLNTLVDLWKRNHMLYMSPYVEGLVHNPGGAPRIGFANIGPYPVEVTQHIGGISAFIDAKAYKNFRWEDQFKHGNQDSEASLAFRKMGYMPCYIPIHRVMHMDTTIGQEKKYKDYFERRVKEKTEVA